MRMEFVKFRLIDQRESRSQGRLVWYNTAVRADRIESTRWLTAVDRLVLAHDLEVDAAVIPQSLIGLYARTNQGEQFMLHVQPARLEAMHPELMPEPPEFEDDLLDEKQTAERVAELLAGREERQQQEQDQARMLESLLGRRPNVGEG